ncbi:oligosaccharide flippase family protein [Wohlfahrtiimonas chitiniclastica]|uniref:oligosaccharide flippase family protein n=1 Tax=Wohlfahrtiimonas chitiniclastica TaxID=400946 RepID=UPI0021579325|nr:oligosaccharide flippase family protein [Wohlfahrtiimonas chitiniclastica]MDC7251909.1 hypothetical protein [Wohlfahrtiimonas chitiniclastica]
MNTSVFVNTIIVTIEKVIQLFLALFVSGLIARFLTVEEFGYWQFSVQMLAYAGVFGLVCGAEILLPRLANGDVNHILTNALILRIIFGVLTFAIAVIAIYLLGVSHETFLFSVLLFIILLFIEPFAVFACYLQSEVKNTPLAIIRLMSLSARTLIVIFIVSFSLSIYSLAFAWIIEALITSIGYLICFRIYRAENIGINLHLLNYRYMKELVLIGLMFMLGQLLLMSSMRLDRIIVAKITDASFSGNYLVMTQLFDSLYQLIVIINLVFVTSFLYKNNNNFKSDLKLMCKLLGFYIVISMIGSIVLFMISESLIILIYSDKYTLAVDFLEHIAFVIPLLTTSVLLFAIFFKYGKYYYYIITNLFGFISVCIYVYIVAQSAQFFNFIYTPYLYMSCVIITSIIFLQRMMHHET